MGPSQPANAVLDVIDLHKSYGALRVLHGVTCRLGAGERLALTGPSGSGKSTLLNCIGGIDRADSGTVRLLGDSLETLKAEQLAAVRRRRIGTVFQFFHLLPTLSAFENVELPLQLLGVATADRRTRVDALLQRVGVSHRANAYPDQLSGGEMQRVAIARALVHRPPVILADEPTGNLDSANGETILALLRELSDETGTSMVLVTHSEDVAAICHRELVLRDGKIVEERHR
ncbi:MAG: ABC transporter ATP-binding protein [Acidobacteriota bacterium]